MPSTAQYVEQVYIKHNGQMLPTAQTDQLLSVEVDQSLYLPDMFALQFRDAGAELLTKDVFKPGAEMEISLKVGETQAVLIKGEVTNLEPHLDPDGRSTLTVRGYSRAHRLHRIRQTKSYQQITDSDLARQLAGAGSLSAQVTATSEVYPYLLQTNQTDWEFLVERARRIGYRLWVDGRTLHFAPPPESPPTTTLVWGENLAEFHPRLSTLDQVKNVTVRGYDAKTKKAIVGQASSGTDQVEIGVTQDGGSAAQKAHSVTGKQIIVTRPIYTQGEADKLAQTVLNDHNAGFIQGDGVCGGEPAVRAGTDVVIAGLGPRFNGTYLVTRAVHTYDHRGYQTHFWVSGHAGTASLAGLLGANGQAPAGPAVAKDRPTALGMVVGLVTNNVDPENMGRVRVKFPWLSETDESWWARVVMPMAGATRGMVYFPEVNDEVVCAFELADPQHVYVLGAVWNGQDALPKPTDWFIAGGNVIRRATYSRIGHNFIIDDNDDTSGFVLQDKTAKNEIHINSDTHSVADRIIVNAKTGIVLKDNDGKNQMRINSGTHDTPNTVEITADQDIIVTATNNKITITAKGDIEITATGGILIKSQQTVDVQAQQDIKMTANGKFSIAGLQGVQIDSSGGKTTLSGTAGVAISSNAQTTVAGVAGVEVSSQAMAAFKGLAGVEVSTPAIATVRGSLLNLNS